jgi:CheY-like chemotaxis protein
MKSCRPMKEILLVEDDDDLRELMAHLLGRSGYGVRHASNGAEALRELHGPRPMPALVLLDLWMPVMSGAEFLRALTAPDRASWPPIVVVSAVADRHRPEGAVAYLRKPMTEDELLQVVQAHAR